jgi:hypothetical protein
MISDIHWPDWIAAGLACWAGSFVVADMAGIGPSAPRGAP